MKSKFFKFVLPAFAILLAMSLSFATEVNTPSEIGYYDHPVIGATLVPGGVNCQEQGTIDCTYNGYQVFKELALTTPLRKN